MSNRKHVAFLHPDLGIGGAEKLIVEAAVALRDKGHRVTVYTSYYDEKRCFEKTKGLDVIVAGDFLPRKFLGRFHIVFALLRAAWLALYVSLVSTADIFITDQIALYNIILKTLTLKSVVFYCHFPDQLLTQRTSLLKTLYRIPFDIVEEVSTGAADTVLVNSQFTASVFRRTFRWLRSTTLTVLYPAVALPPRRSRRRARDSTTFLSINRFERKKNLALAIRALAELRKSMGARAFEASGVRLVLAGGCDARVAENVEYHAELTRLARETLKFSSKQVEFKLSFDDAEKASLISSAIAVLYTPKGEHFGIVPIEAMSYNTPVIAMDSGGPKETVADGKTGFLCPESPTEWAERMRRIVDDQKLAVKMGNAGRKRVEDSFSFEAFANGFDRAVVDATNAGTLRLVLTAVLVSAIALLYALY